MLNDGINNLWPTTIIKDTIKDKELLDAVTNELFVMYDLYDPPSDIRQDNIFNSGSPVLERFKNEIVMPCFDRYLKEVYNIELKNYPHSFLRGWVAGYANGYFMVNHNHSGSHLSAVFYLLAEEDNSGGEIIFEDPRVNANRGYPTEMLTHFKALSHQPKTGDLVVFPSFLYHCVSPYNNKYRLAVPVDFNLADRD